MKKIMSALLMGFLGLIGTFAWAGSAREDTVDRLQKSVGVLQAVMATPDKGIPEEVLSRRKMHFWSYLDLIKGGFVFGGKVRTRRSPAAVTRQPVGALPHSSQSVAVAGVCKSASKAST